MKDRTFCRKCWTEYDASMLPAECPHLDGDSFVAGGVHWRVIIALPEDAVPTHVGEDD